MPDHPTAGRPRAGRGRPAWLVVPIGLAAAASALLGVGGRSASATTIDPCYGYDICVHMTLGAFPGNGPDGNGRVTSSPAGLDCRYISGNPDPTSTCEHYFHANFVSSITITLDEVADADSSLYCELTHTYASTCDEVLKYLGSTEAPHDVEIRRNWTVSVASDPVQGGVIQSSPSGIGCTAIGGTCEATWLSGTTVSLVPTALPGYAFVGWLGDCAGQGTTCSFQLHSDVDATAFFRSTAPAPSPTGASQPTASPGASTTPTARPTARPTPGAPSTPGPTQPAPEPLRTGPTPAPGTSDPGASGAMASPADDVAGPFGSLVASVAPAPVAFGAPGPPSSGDAGSSSTDVGATSRDVDLTPVIAAIVGVGVLLAVAIVVAAAILRGRRRGSGSVA